MADIKDADKFEETWARCRAKLKTIELRSFDKEAGGDKVVAHNATVHLEQVDETNYFLGIYTETEYLLISIGSDSGRDKMRAVAYEGGKALPQDLDKPNGSSSGKG